MMMRNMFAKYPGGRWTRHFSTSSSSSSSSSSTLKRVWDEQSVSSLFLAFAGGYFGCCTMNLLKRKALKEKVERMIDEHGEYAKVMFTRYYRQHGITIDERLFDKPGTKSKKTNAGNRE